MQVGSRASPLSQMAKRHFNLHETLYAIPRKTKKKGQAMPEWKLTETTHPEQDQCCIVFDTYDKQIKLLCFNEFNKCWDTEDGDDYYCDIERVSHWMPLPAKPTKRNA